MTKNEYLDQLERAIDATDLHSVLTLIGDVCCGKADHIGANWQDEDLAKDWQRAATQIRKCADHGHILLVSRKH